MSDIIHQYVYKTLIYLALERFPEDISQVRSLPFRVVCGEEWRDSQMHIAACSVHYDGGEKTFANRAEAVAWLREEG